MADFFPRKTIAWTQIEEPSFVRRVTTSVLAMALVTGVVLRVFRALALRHEAPGIGYLLGMFALGAVAFLLAATAHLGNYTLRHWWWRAPVFGLLEAAFEMLTSLALIAAGLERVGTGRAGYGDWVPMAYNALPLRVVVVCVFALVLAGVVQIIRRLMLRAERRSGTVEAVQRGAEQERAEHQRATAFEATVHEPGAPDQEKH